MILALIYVISGTWFAHFAIYNNIAEGFFLLFLFSRRVYPDVHFLYVA